MAGRSVSLAEVFRAQASALQKAMHTSMPGVVKSYDPTTKTADVQPVIKEPLYDPEDGTAMDSAELPVIPNVPVQFPRGGGWHMSFALEEGDHVTLLFSEAATGNWRATGEVSEPGDVRRHGLGYPVALLGAHPDADLVADDSQTPPNPLTAGKLILGKDGEPGKQIRIGADGLEIGAVPAPVAMAAGVTAALNTLKASVGPLLGVGKPAFDTEMDAAILQVAATLIKGM